MFTVYTDLSGRLGGNLKADEVPGCWWLEVVSLVKAAAKDGSPG